jgi:multidrug resistance efflux pump
MKGFVAEPDDAVGMERGSNGHAGERRSPPPRASASWLLRIGAFVVLAAAAAWAYYANVYSAKPAMDMSMRVSAGDAAFPIVAAAVERAPVSGVVTYTGAVAAFNEEDIFPRVTGRIVEMLAYPGDAVRAGQVVARLDDVELTSRVREAEAMAATALANRAQMEADVTASGHGVVQMERGAMVEAELAYASGAQPLQRLVASGAISRQEYENDRSLALALEAGARAAGEAEQARAMETSARRKLDAAESMAPGSGGRATAQIVRDYVSIVAPTGGSVVKRLVAPGVLVQPGMAILKIDRSRPPRANVGEGHRADPGQSPVTVTTTAGPGLTAA